MNNKHYIVIYRTRDGMYQMIDHIYNEDSAYAVLTMVIIAGYKDARIEYVDTNEAELEVIANILRKYFSIGDSYVYNLTRSKEAFTVGTMTLEDFEEFDEDSVEDLAAYLVKHGVRVPTEMIV